MFKYLILFLATLSYGQVTQLFQYTPFQGANKRTVHNATIYIVNQETSDSLLLTEYAGAKSGTYYRDNVASGVYKIYIQTLGGIQTLVQSGYPFGIKTLSEFGSQLSDSLSARILTDSSASYMVDYSIPSTKIDTGAVTTVGILDNTIDYSDLNTALQGLINSNLYDIQEPAVNSAFQMYVRWAHYAFDRYYDADSAMCYFQFDESDSTYNADRRVVVNYMEFLQELHKVTGEVIYLNKLEELYLALDAVGDSVVTSHTSATTCRSIYVNPHSVFGVAFAHTDALYHLAGYYLYQQTGTARYLQDFKDFVDVWYSGMVRDTESFSPAEIGWAWPYNYTGQAVANTRVNVGTPVFNVFGTLKANNITTGEITSTAMMDSIIDSTDTWINQTWVYDAASDSGGWAIRVSTVPSISSTYTGLSIRAYVDGIELAGQDTTVVDSMMYRMKKMSRYYTADTDITKQDRASYYNFKQAFLLKYLKEEWGETDYIDANVANARLANATRWRFFDGVNVTENGVVDGQRNMLQTVLTSLVYLLRYGNDWDWNEDYTQFATDDYVNGFSNYWRMEDGYYHQNRSVAGVLAVYSKAMGGFPSSANPQAWDPDTTTGAYSNGVITINYPAQHNGGINISYQHKMGSPFSLLTATPDTVVRWYLPNNEGDWYLFYYDSTFTFQAVEGGDFADGTTLTIRADYGIYVHEVNASGGTKRGYGLIWDGSQSVIDIAYASPSTSYKFTSQGETDSLYVLSHETDVADFFINGSSLTYTNEAVKDILAMMKLLRENGLQYNGVLTDKR